jgi:hypothetical protein
MVVSYGVLFCLTNDTLHIAANVSQPFTPLRHNVAQARPSAGL